MSRTWLAGNFGGQDILNRARWIQNYGVAQVSTVYPSVGSTGTFAVAGVASLISASQQLLPPVTDGTSLNILTFPLIGSTTKPNYALLASAANNQDIDGSSYTAGWTAIAQTILSLGLNSPSTILRIGWEMNLGNTYPWSVPFGIGPMAANAANYVAAWKLAHDAVIAVCPLVKFELNYNVQNGGIDSFNSMNPGPSYIDIYSIDFYDYGTNPITTQSAFTSYQHTGVNGTYGNVANDGLSINAVAAYCAANNKQFAISEWGVSGTASSSVIRDNPTFIDLMFSALSYVQTTWPSVMSHDSYFDTGPHYLPHNPLSSVEYRKVWWGRTTTETGVAPVPYVFPPLATGAHSVTVTAVNSQGESASTSTGPFSVTAAAPGVMPTLNLASKSDVQATIAWTGTATGAADHYAITITPIPSGKTSTFYGVFSSANQNQQFVGLTASTQYTATVTPEIGTNGTVTGTSKSITFTTATSGSAVLSAPGMPSAVTAMAGGGEAIISWSAPNSSGNSAITSYAVYATTMGNVTTVTNTSNTNTSLLVTGLTPGITYAFTVAATNAVGNGPVSSSIASVTPVAALTASNAPSVNGVSAGYNTATVDFTPNGASSYMVVAAPPASSGLAIVVATGTASPISFYASNPALPVIGSNTNNPSATMYSFSAYAVSSGGISLPSPSVAATINPMTVTGGVAAITSNTTAQITWAGVNGNPTHYTGTKVFVPIGTTAAPLSSFTYTGLVGTDTGSQTTNRTAITIAPMIQNTAGTVQVYGTQTKFYVDTGTGVIG